MSTNEQKLSFDAIKAVDEIKKSLIEGFKSYNIEIEEINVNIREIKFAGEICNRISYEVKTKRGFYSYTYELYPNRSKSLQHMARYHMCSMSCLYKSILLKEGNY